MKKIVVILFALALFLGVNNASKATVLTFDDLTDNSGGTPIPNGYGGLNWDNMYVLNTANFLSQYGQSGYSNGVVSSPNVALNWYANPGTVSVSDPSTFTFNSADFTAAWNDGLSIEAKGFQSGNPNPVDDVTFTVNTESPTLETLNFQNIDALTFISSGGTPAGYFGQGTHFAMDNFTYNEPVNPIPAPEPTSMLLGFMSIGGLLGIKKRK